MKHLSPEVQAQAREWADSVCSGLEPSAFELMLRHLDWMLETTRTINLTGVKEPLPAVRLHLVDSLQALPEVNDSPTGLLIDIGTGGGYPGVPLAVATGRPALLVDSVRKKSDALNGFLVHESLVPRVSVSASRAEELTDCRENASVVTARAVSPLPCLVELASPLLQRGGVLVAMKARLEDSELSRGREAAALCGMEERSVRRFTLPEGDEARTIVAYEKTGKPKIQLPRRTGMAQNRPLC